jgi:hypothetical protein
MMIRMKPTSKGREKSLESSCSRQRPSVSRNHSLKEMPPGITLVMSNQVVFIINLINNFTYNL